MVGVGEIGEECEIGVDECGVAVNVGVKVSGIERRLCDVEVGVAGAEEKVDDEDGEATEDYDGPKEGAADGG